MLDENGDQASHYCGSETFAPEMPWRGEGFVFPSHGATLNGEDSCVTSSRALQSSSSLQKNPLVRRHLSGNSVVVLQKVQVLFYDGQPENRHPILLKLEVTHWGLIYEVDCVSSHVLSCADKETFCDLSDICIFRDIQHNITWISPTILGFDLDGHDFSKIDRDNWLLKEKGVPLNVFLQLPQCPSIRVGDVLPFMDVQLAEKLHMHLERVHRSCAPLFLSDVANTLLGKRLVEVLSGVSIRAPTVSEEIEVADGRPSAVVTIVLWPLVLFAVAILINFLGLGVLWIVTPTSDASDTSTRNDGIVPYC
ncbi:hypothetical protein FGB62_160g014 [Gracilaria domingensis]|nr:hypothetical protein FGB62_160g014 [Gracilaria domingensis]